jgi:hypothetical protein
LDICCFFFWFVALYPRPIKCDYLWQKCLVSFKAVLNDLTLVEKISLLLLTQQVCHEFCNKPTHI